MFTGIVEAVGRVLLASEAILEVEAPESFAPDGIREGESVAVNGCCLTAKEAAMLRFDLSPETRARTALGDLRQGDPVNLERAMRADGRFGGHIVQGHVDATGELVEARAAENATVLRFAVPREFDRYLIDKGSVAVQGVSLTVVAPRAGQFDVWAIPHTLGATNLGALAPGDRVNIEFDVLAKYVERLISG